MNNRIFWITLCFTLLLTVTLSAQTAVCDYNCFTVAVGKTATTDGSVMLVHNEDDSGDQLLNFYLVPPLNHEPGETVKFKSGGTTNQAEKTIGYLWLELPGMPSSDGFMNDYGVVVVSDQCLSREDKPELTDGGIIYQLRCIMAQRATSARHAVQIAGELVEKYGYNSSGRTYTIADPNEAWVFSAVNGKHWVAQRVPDNQVMVIPNYYTIEEVDLKDSTNFLACSDLISYAEMRGWYDAKQQGAFNFRNVYGLAGNLTDSHNVDRKWVAMNMLSNRKWSQEESYPFAFAPKEKISLQMMFDLLGNHYEETPLFTGAFGEAGNPHNTTMFRSVCCNSTQYGFVAQLRSELPKEIGNILWIAPFRPCTQPFVPWYLGTTEIPEGYSQFENYSIAEEKHWDVPESFRARFPDHKFWQYVDTANAIDKDYANQIERVQKEKQQKQALWFQQQSEIEARALELYQTDREGAKELLTEYTFELLKEKRF